MASYLLRQLPRVVRQLEQDVETVIDVLRPGPLGIIEHKFTVQEVKEAESIVEKAVANWKRN
ncbi:zinc metalloproteinase aureolysin [Carex rostrata]